MLFSSPIFLFIFLPLVFLGYFLLRKVVKKTIVLNLFLLSVSLFFYAWGEPKYIALLVFTIIVNYLIGRFLSISSSKRRKLSLLLVGVAFDIGLLGLFKYSNFAITNINKLFEVDIALLDIRLPIGISFFIFQAISYLVDIYRKKEVKEPGSLLNVALYISLFPQLIAGPIVRYKDIAEQLLKRTVSVDNIDAGLKRFVLGLFKKVIIANNVAIIADYTFNNLTGISGIEAWIGAIAYSLQIFFDFSGYSDMAIGLGKLFGFNIPENFNYPYISKTATDFWRRWHISLSTWFRDYLYFPLGGSKRGAAMTYVNIFIVFTLSGLWHGASWNFILWGAMYGFLLSIERIFKKFFFNDKFSIFLHGYMLLITIFGWVLFRAQGFTQAKDYIIKMTTDASFSLSNISSLLDPRMIAVFVLGLLLSTPILNKLQTTIKSKFESKEILYLVLQSILVLGIFLYTVLNIASSTFQPFIYFQF